MALKQHKPSSAARRGLITVDRSELWKGRPIKSLTRGKSSSGGRNNLGRMTSRHRGGGHKRAWRQVDFKRRKFDVPSVVERIEYDPNRSAFIALLKYETGELSYILAPQRLHAGDRVISGAQVDVQPGNAMPLENMPIGTVIHNIELKAGKGAQIARSAGAYAQLVGRDGDYAIVRLKSGEQRLIHAKCLASVGAVSNPDHSNQKLAKAGRNRWRGKRPHVRGVAMNPVDHPHGGGEGRSSGGRHPVTPWGQSTKGKRTRARKTSDRYIVRSRHERRKGRR